MVTTMTVAETGQIMDVLATAYPQFYARQTPKELDRAVTLWAAMFADDDYDTVLAAVRAFIVSDKKGFPPHIGAIKDRMRMLVYPDTLGESEAWALVVKACRNGIYGYREEFAKLPEAVQRAVGIPETLRSWAMADEDVFATVIASNFMRAYRERNELERERNMLPEKVKREIAKLADGMRLRLEDGNDTARD